MLLQRIGALIGFDSRFRFMVGGVLKLINSFFKVSFEELGFRVPGSG